MPHELTEHRIRTCPRLVLDRLLWTHVFCPLMGEEFFNEAVLQGWWQMAPWAATGKVAEAMADHKFGITVQNLSDGSWDIEFGNELGQSGNFRHKDPYEAAARAALLALIAGAQTP